MKRILVVKLADLGDVLTATPALRAVRETWPRAQIDMLVTPPTRGLVDGLPGVARVLTFDKFAFDRPRDLLSVRRWHTLLVLGGGLRGGAYDQVFILHHLTTQFGTLKYAALALASGASHRIGLDNGRGWFLTRRARDLGFGARHEVEYWLDTAASVGASTTDLRLEMPVHPTDEAFAGRTLGTRRPIVIHPGSGGHSLARRWQPDGFAHVGDALLAQGHTVALVGRPEDGGAEMRAAMHHPERLLDLTGKTTVGQLGALLRRAALFVGSDSGVMHMAAAAGAPLVAIFGPTNVRAWSPWRGNPAPMTVIRTSMPCSPCAYVAGRVGQRAGCEARWCLAWIGVEQVLQAIEGILDRTREKP